MTDLDNQIKSGVTPNFLSCIFFDCFCIHIYNFNVFFNIAFISEIITNNEFVTLGHG